MRNVIRIAVHVVHVFSFAWVLLAGILGVVYEIVGPAKFERILSGFGIPKVFEKLWGISAVMLFLLIVTYVIKTSLD